MRLSARPASTFPPSPFASCPPACGSADEFSAPDGGAWVPAGRPYSPWPISVGTPLCQARRRVRGRQSPPSTGTSLRPSNSWPSFGGRWLFDVRPQRLIGDEDALKFAATSEAAAACGWRYTVATGWHPHVLSVLDALSAQRRPLQDPLGLQEELVAAVTAGPLPFVDLVEATSLPAVARAQALHLLWRRRLGVDLGRPLGDTSVVSLNDRTQEGS